MPETLKFAAIVCIIIMLLIVIVLLGVCLIANPFL